MKSYFNRAFTIIELLIIIGLISLITTVSIASYSSFLETSKLKSETQRLLSILTLAQKRAVAGESVSGGICAAGYSFSGIVITTVAGGGYTMQGQCSQDSNPLNTSTYSTITYSVDPTNTNVRFLSSTTVVFPKLTGIPTSNASIVLKNIANSTCSTIAVNSGLIGSSDTTCP